jgi:aspartyl-tRNA(Asn)/glutamyl-tRNA(Gln) amidotransferase subunit B
LEVNTGDLEKGVIRFEANISLRPGGSDSLGTRTEIKNLNSFRALVDSLNYEIARQRSILEAGRTVVQDTLGWNESTGVTFSQRGKEEAHDYRYFPEPDLPPIVISADWIENERAKLPELPDAKALRYQQEFGLSSYESAILTEDRSLAEWFEAAVSAGGDVGAVTKWMTNVLFSLMNENKTAVDQLKITPEGLVGLLNLVEIGTINANTAKDVLAEMFISGKDPETIVNEKGIAQISDKDQIASIIDGILEANPDQLSSYFAGKEGIRGWFVGQVMRETRGKANPQVVNHLLSQKLDELRPQGD